MKFQTTDKWKNWWKHREIDWKKHYLVSFNHPHRRVISAALRLFPWLSLFEIGVGGGANLVRIIKDFPGRQIGGADINKDAIALCNETFKGGYFKVGSGDNLMVSDKAGDVILTDMTLIYVSPLKIDKYLNEMKRLARSYVVLCEFHSASWWNRLALYLNEGYYAHNYEKCLRKIGFYDLYLYKLRPEDWPEENGMAGHEPQKTFAYVIVAKVPKR